MTFRLGFGVTFDEAIEAASRRKVTLPETFYGEIPERLRAHAFTVSGMTALQQVQDVLDSLNAKLRAGDSFEAWKKRALEQDWGLSKARLELISRMHAQTAYMAGQWEQFRAHAKTRPFLMYSAVNDARTRPTHRAMSGYIASVEDPMWHVWSPPCGFNCRCALISLTEPQAKDRGLGQQTLPTSVKPDPGFGQPPQDAGDRMRIMLEQRAKDAGPLMEGIVEKILGRGYAFPPLEQQEISFAAAIREELADEYGTRYDVLTDAELLGINAYAQDSGRINAYLRGLSSFLSEEERRHIVGIQSGIPRLSDGVERITYRGIPENVSVVDRAEDIFAEGSVFRSQAPFSTTEEQELAEAFEKLGEGETFFFTVKGRSAANIDGFYESVEYEHLYPATTHFLVTRVQRDGRRWIIELEETDLPADFRFSLP